MTGPKIVDMIRLRLEILKHDQKLETDEDELFSLSARIDELMHLLYAIDNPNEQIYTRFQ